jgi:glycogen synthase
MKRFFYAAAGPGDIIKAHQHWRESVDDPNEVSLTFSSQIAAFCNDCRAPTLMVSPQGDGRVHEDALFQLEHWKKPQLRGIAYHLGEIRYGLRLLNRARRFRADTALIDVGAMPVFMMSLFALLRIKVVVILHNTLWPSGFPPMRSVSRFILLLDRCLFWRNSPHAVIGVSHECIRQVESLSPNASYQRLVSLAQFDPHYFEQIAPPPLGGPFNILFVGRAERAKGLLDLVDMAAHVDAKQPGLVRWLVCGDGPHLADLRARITDRGLDSIFEVAGWTRPADLIAYYSRSHAAIVPTRSDFAEGMAMTAIQAICAGRPLITCAVVPALEHLRAASIEAVTDNAESYADMVYRLATDKDLYRQLQSHCAPLSRQFYDRRTGLRAALHKAFE